ncbi:MAG: PorT family protein, partial [Bacteroidetes bacterium]|nr:PorT family protein [Bacteroidota bacterium]
VLGVYTNFPDQRDTLKSRIKLGFSVAGFVSFPMKKNCSFQAEGGFSQQGRSYTYGPSGDKWSSTYQFIDLSMALRKNFKLKIIKNIGTNWFVNAGPNINYWIGGKGSLVPYVGRTQNYSFAFDTPPGPDYTKIYLNNINRWLYGINIGIGFSAVTLKNQMILTELRMTWGQTYVGQKGSEFINGVNGIGDELSLKCNLKVLNLSVAYVFDRDLQKGKMGKSTKKVK